MLETAGTLEDQARRAKTVARRLASLSEGLKNDALSAMARGLRARTEEILDANRKDLEAGREHGLSTALMDRLALDPSRVEAMAGGLEDLLSLPDPVGRETAWRRPNGLLIRRVRVPLGVLCIVYEARPNVTVEAAGLAFKSGNACLLRGSRSAVHSNRLLVEVLQQALKDQRLPVDMIQMVEDTSRESVGKLARMNGLIDCMIPRGGADLIQNVIQSATVPVIETGVGNCHLYVHRDADLAMAVELVVNSKTHRPGVCNALETLLVDAPIAGDFLPRVATELAARKVEIRGCPLTRQHLTQARPATPEDWDTEFLDLILAVKVVDGLDQALAHIQTHGSGHTEAVVTSSLAVARRFQMEVDACAVNVNASTRFTDGGQFGFGAEIGISTQKMHARGPLGLPELTTVKYLVEGEGQVRH